jgi:hypothetical protein
LLSAFGSGWENMVLPSPLIPKEFLLRGVRIKLALAIGYPLSTIRR